jgi:D-alanine-D-alanine ligase
VLDGKAMGAIEIVPKGGAYDYKAKYSQGQTDYYFPARLSPQEHSEIMALAEQAAVAVDAPGAIRLDALLSAGGNPYVLEVNTLPGMTPTSLLPKIAAGIGLDFADLCEEILRRARLNVGMALKDNGPSDDEPTKDAAAPAPAASALEQR